MLGRKVIKKHDEIRSRLSKETLKVLEDARVHSPAFGGGNKELWNEAAQKFNEAAHKEIGKDADSIELPTYE